MRAKRGPFKDKQEIANYDIKQNDKRKAKANKKPAVRDDGRNQKLV